MASEGIRLLFVQTGDGNGEALKQYLGSLTGDQIGLHIVTTSDEIRARANENWDAVVLDIDSADGRKEDMQEKIKLFCGGIPVVDLADGPAEVVSLGTYAALESYFSDTPAHTLALLRGFNHVIEHRRLHERVEALEERIYKIDRNDHQTGLWTHAYIMERLHELYNDWKRYSYPMTLCMFAITDLEQVNETWGGEVGDTVLVKFGEVIRAVKRNTDYAARLDHDLFCIAMPSTPLQSAMIGVERVRDALQRTVFSGKSKDNFTVGTSYGVVQLAQRHTSLDDLIGEAGELLERARTSGMNEISVGD